MDQQIIITTEPIKTCAFTGHRKVDADFNIADLDEAIENLIKEGVDTFYNGVARGFDLLSAEIILQKKKNYPHIKLVVCIPCYGQEKYYTEEEKERYKNVCENADERVVLSEHYTRFCMQNRDRYMADLADVLIAYKRSDKGGTAYTVGYFMKKYPHKRIVFI